MNEIIWEYWKDQGDEQEKEGIPSQSWHRPHVVVDHRQALHVCVCMWLP